MAHGQATIQEGTSVPDPGSLVMEACHAQGMVARAQGAHGMVRDVPTGDEASILVSSCSGSS